MNQNMFESVFNQLYIQTDNDKDILKRSVVSNTVRFHEDLSGERNNKEYSSKRFDEWLLKRVGRREFEIDGSKNKTQIIKGYNEYHTRYFLTVAVSFKSLITVFIFWEIGSVCASCSAIDT